MSNAIYTRTCQMCGTVMQGVNSRKLYCTDCLDRRRQEQNRLWQQEHLRERKALQKQAQLRAKAWSKRCQTTDQSIDEIVQAAAAAGCSYGRQVAHLEGRC